MLDGTMDGQFVGTQDGKLGPTVGEYDLVGL